MSAGDVHEVGGHRFEETLHGPNIERECMDCGGLCYGVPSFPEPRCGECLWAHVVKRKLR